AGIYNTYSAIDQLSVWPRENMIDILFEKFTDLKLRRNEEKRKAGSDVTFYTPYYSYDSDNPRNKITIVGNPSLSEVKTVMIGVRNNSNTRKSVEVWVNELRLTDFNEDGGWAARGNLNVSLSDLATINAGAHIETAGFGGIEQSVGQRRLDDYYMYNFAASVDLGRFVPKAAKLTAPFYYAYSKQINSPKYNPLDGDILLSESLKSVQTQAEKDSIKAFSQDKLVNTSLSLSGIKVNANSKNPMPYDPANFSISYSQNSTERQNPTIAWETTKDYRLNLTYAYSPAIKPFEPFAKNKSKSPVMKPIQAFNINYLPNSISLTSDISRSYYEIQLRDMSNPGSSNFENVPIAYRKEFYWNRGFDLNWKLTKGLQLVFNNTTNARIEEPDVVVNKELYPDEYKIWKDSVWQSIRGMGTPLSYSQRFNLSYTLPLALLPGLDWINSTAKYSATYTWDKGAFIDAETILGNEIANNVVFQLDGSFDFMKLYNKSPFLKEVNAKFNPTRNTAVSNRRPNARDTQKKSEPKKFEQQITLSNDSAVVVTHNLNTKNIRVRAYRSDSTSYPIKYKLAGNSGIRIQNRDTIPLKIRITIGPDAKEASWYKVAQYAARGMMMVRRATVMYNQTNMTQIPGFLPEIGDFTGQGNGGAPGWNFAFGFVDGKSYVHEAKARGWLLGDSTVISPAVLSHSRDFSATVELEPIRGLKIDLNGRWNHIESSSIQYMFNGMPETRGGQFTMTTIALRSAFEKSNSANGYFSGSFNRFLENRAQIAARINGMYDGTRYPEGTMLAGQPFDAANGGVDVNSPDVLIPAFLSAYTVGSPNTMSLSAFPSIASLLPNWKISYDGLSHLPWIKDNLKSVVLSHNYQSTYKIGAYDSYQTWMPVAGRSDIGFVTDVQSDLPVPAFQYAIASVIITEVFAPLVGLTVTLKNNISCTGEYKTSRTLSLNMSANQIVEALREDFVLGIGYKFINFNEVLKMKAGKNVNHDLTLRGDISYNRMVSIIRKIDEAYNEPVSGTQTMTIKLSADYNFSKALTLRAFFDRQVNTPLVSSTSFPISTTNFGMAVRFSLAR
ncbi:MAG: cell surface protein SprA, partial [Bacteroidales bacterium]|nr:cell surface protein SprA [Bacteroidales bacterium]